jgi:hypothetical protein
LDALGLRYFGDALAWSWPVATKKAESMTVPSANMICNGGKWECGNHFFIITNEGHKRSHSSRKKPTKGYTHIGCPVCIPWQQSCHVGTSGMGPPVCPSFFEGFQVQALPLHFPFPSEGCRFCCGVGGGAVFVTAFTQKVRGLRKVRYWGALTTGY